MNESSDPFRYCNHDLKEELKESMKIKLDLEFLEYLERKNPEEFVTNAELIRCMEIIINSWKNKNA